MSEGEWKDVPEGMTKYKVAKTCVSFATDDFVIGQGFEYPNLVRIGSFDRAFLERFLQLADRHAEFVIHIDTRRKRLGPSRIGEHWLAPKVDDTKEDGVVIVKKK